jgi:Pentapeptide repeats (8 copies)
MEMWIVIGVALVAAVVVAALYLVTYFYLAPRAAGSFRLTDPEKAAFQDSYTKTIAQLFAGFAVVGTFAWTIFKDGETLRQTAITAANQQFIDASKLSTDQNAEKSAAGNYSFEKLVLAYPEYCATVTDILRSQIYARAAKMKPPKEGAPPLHVKSDIMAAVKVLGAIPRCSGPLRLVDAYLAGADFGRTKSAFADANFEAAKLYGAYFGWNVLDKAKFNGAGMADRDAYGGDDKAWEDVKTKDYWKDIKYNFIVNFDNSSLKSAQFKNASVAGASFRNAALDDATFENTDISRADFSGASGLETAFFGASDPETAKKLTAACFKGDPEKPIGLGDDFLELHKVARTCNR